MLLNQSPDELVNQVDTAHFALFCTPVINLFPLEIDSLELPTQKLRLQADNEIVMRPVPLAPFDYEVFRIERLYGHVEASSERLEFMPRYQALNQDEGAHGRYYTTRRANREHRETTRRYGTRTPYISTDLFAALVDQHGVAYPERMNYMSALILATNGDLPNLMACNGQRDLTPLPSTPVAGIGLVRAPSRPRPPYAHGEAAWELIRQLNFGFQALAAGEGLRSGEGLRKMLKLFVGNDHVLLQQIDAIRGLTLRAVARSMPGNRDIPIGRGHALGLTIDETGFEGKSPYLFGVVLDRYLARHVSKHSFVQLDLHSVQRGLIESFPVRVGTRGVA